MENQRGIFILTAFKKILENLIYNDKYASIDEHMSESNIGGRRNRTSSDHLFVAHGIINSVINGDEDCVDFLVYDVKKAFDKLNLQDTMNDLYDTIAQEERDDKIALLFEANKENQVAINTPVGRTQSINLKELVQQGGKLRPILWQNSIKNVGKK